MQRQRAAWETRYIGTELGFTDICTNFAEVLRMLVLTAHIRCEGLNF